MPVLLLLVDPEADRLAGPLTLALPGLDVVSAPTAVAARAYLAGTRFDAVAVRAGTEGADDLEALADGLGVVGGVHRYGLGGPTGIASALGPRLGLAPSAPSPEVSETRAPALHDPLREVLEALRADIGRVAHDLANPLAVVSGNAQLGAELARALGADPSIGSAFAEIEEAGQVLADRIGQLATLRERLDALL